MHSLIFYICVKLNTMDNSENAAWNETHQGNRVPINDTGLEGAPASLHGSIPEWTEGSLNRAVRETYRIQPNTILSSIPALIMSGEADLKSLRTFVVRDMLYGFAGDSRDRTPGDMMSFRGYPTPVILSNALTPYAYASIRPLSLGGRLGTTEGEWAIYKLNLRIKYPLPYNTHIKFVYGLGVDTITFEVLILKGETKIGACREIGALAWEYPIAKVAFLSTNTGRVTGALAQSATKTDVLQAPYYGTIPPIAGSISESTYRPTAPKIGYPIGYAVFNPRINNVPCFISSCNKLTATDLFSSSAAPMELFARKTALTLSVGTLIYSDADCNVFVASGKYVFPEFLYTSATGPIYFIRTYMVIGAAGMIESISLNLNVGTDTCAIDNPCR